MDSTPRWQMRWAVRQQFDIAKYPERPQRPRPAHSIASTSASTESKLTADTRSSSSTLSTTSFAADVPRSKQLQERRKAGNLLSIDIKSTRTTETGSTLSTMSVESDGKSFDFPCPPTPRTPHKATPSPELRRSRSPIVIVEGDHLFTTPAIGDVRKRPRRSSSADSALPPIPPQRAQRTTFGYPAQIWNQVIDEGRSVDDGFSSSDSDCESDTASSVDSEGSLYNSSTYAPQILTGKGNPSLVSRPIPQLRLPDMEANPLRSERGMPTLVSKNAFSRPKKRQRAPLSSQLDLWIDDLHK